MTASAHAIQGLDAKLRTALDAACARIAPTWPLDQFIAVNPLWGYIDRPVPAAASELAALGGSRMLMPRAWFRERWNAGEFGRDDLLESITRNGSDRRVDELIALLEQDEPPAPRRARVTDVADAGRNVLRDVAWCDFVTHNVSQFCAAYFDEGQAQLGPQRSGLYATWSRQAAHDHSPRLLMGTKDFTARARELPSDPMRLIAEATTALGIEDGQLDAYFNSLLLSVGGWAAWCAYRRWQARLAGDDDDAIEQLLAIRIAWELILLRGAGDATIDARWQAAMRAWPQHDLDAARSQEKDWLLQRALEIAYQRDVCTRLTSHPASAEANGDAAAVPDVQAAFCIDVRSEVFRRALEACSPRIRTFGFAGFFGLPIDYRPLGAPAARPQLPGLLAPALQATDHGGDAALTTRRAGRLDFDLAWKRFKSAATSGFSFVETIGPFYAAKLVTDAAGRSRPVPHHEGAGLSSQERRTLKPRLECVAGGGDLAPEARIDLAANILAAMSLTKNFARLVLLAGHGSETVNNPHAAGLDCGACCGQTGEVNARVLAALLNDARVRNGLRSRGVEVPADTHFLAALHNTTTDEVLLYETEDLPTSHRDDLARLREWLQAAGDRARAERAANLGLAAQPTATLQASIAKRAKDWSQVRPEWGLANCAAFVVAPRERTRAVNLDGRSFLHDYRWRDDRGFGILELIMTAPMVVTHWINMQYYASTVDNRRYGSGNKVLHNVVGGHIGVFEGNGGDLRIGLPMQSLHDGQRWMHTPLRLSVFIEAPAAAMEDVLTRHAHVRQLVVNEWLYLFRIDDEGAIFLYRNGAWERRAG